MRLSKHQSCKRRCARCLPRNRLEIGVPIFVSYRAGRCLTRLEVRLESSNVAVRDVSGTSLCARFLARSMGRCSVRGAIDGSRRFRLLRLRLRLRLDSSYERNAEETLLVLCQGLLSSSSHCRRVSCPPLPRRPWRRRAAVRMEAEAGPFRVVVFQVCACLAECTKHTHTTRKLSKTVSFNESFDSRIRQSCPEVAWG